jgi:hypothetical protein
MEMVYATWRPYNSLKGANKNGPLPKPNTYSVVTFKFRIVSGQWHVATLASEEPAYENNNLSRCVELGLQIFVCGNKSRRTTGREAKLFHEISGAFRVSRKQRTSLLGRWCMPAAIF